MDKCGEGKCGYAGYRKFGLAGPFLHGGRNRWSVYMCVARLIRRRCSLVWHGTLPRRDWSPIKVSATFILGQGERLRATTVFFLGIFFFFFDRTWRGSVIERNGGHHASSRFRGVNWVWWCVGSFVGIFLLFFFLREGVRGWIWFWIWGLWWWVNGIRRWFQVDLNNFEWFDEWFIYMWRNWIWRNKFRWKYGCV